MCRLGTEVVKAKPPAQLFSGVVALSAPFAGGIDARGVAKPAYQPSCLRELVPHPGRHDRVSPGNRQPCQRVGERPTAPARIVDDFPNVCLAGVAIELFANSFVCLAFGWSPGASQSREHRIEPGAAVLWRQPVPGDLRICLRVSQLLELIAKDLQGKSCIELGVVDPPPAELSVVVVLYQMVVRVSREGEGIEHEGIDRRQPQQSQAGVGGPKVGQIEGDQVVAEQEVSSAGESIQPAQRRREAATDRQEDHGLAGVGTHPGKRTDAAVPHADFQVEREAAVQFATAILELQRCLLRIQ